MDKLEPALERATDIGIESSPQALTPTGVRNLASRRVGHSRSESLLVLEFFTASATRQVARKVQDLDRTRVLRHRNVIILYTRSRKGTDHEAEILRALRGTPTRD